MMPGFHGFLNLIWTLLLAGAVVWFICWAFGRLSGSKRSCGCCGCARRQESSQTQAEHAADASAAPDAAACGTVRAECRESTGATAGAGRPLMIFLLGLFVGFVVVPFLLHLLAPLLGFGPGVGFGPGHGFWGGPGFHHFWH